MMHLCCLITCKLHDVTSIRQITNILNINFNVDFLIGILVEHMTVHLTGLYFCYIVLGFNIPSNTFQLYLDGACLTQNIT